MVRIYNNSDISNIIKIGKGLHDNYSFNLDLYSNCIVYEQDNNIIGFLTYSLIYDRIEIIDIIIKDIYRKMGYGSELLEYLINIYKQKKCNNITLEVNKNNKDALCFYNRFGFKIVATRKQYYKNEDAYLMELK